MKAALYDEALSRKNNGLDQKHQKNGLVDFEQKRWKEKYDNKINAGIDDEQ